VKSDTGPQITLGDAAAEPDPLSKRRNTASGHRHSPVREKPERALRVREIAGRIEKLSRVLG